MIMRRMAYWGDAILIGVWGATLSSAVGSILGAPRVLQALARDGCFPDGWGGSQKVQGRMIPQVWNGIYYGNRPSSSVPWVTLIL